MSAYPQLDPISAAELERYVAGYRKMRDDATDPEERFHFELMIAVGEAAAIVTMSKSAGLDKAQLFRAIFDCAAKVVTQAVQNCMPPDADLDIAALSTQFGGKILYHLQNTFPPGKGILQ